ncbi:hypothetical protein [Embleya sp. NPDC020630]|uniref:hypothetical protein n=1 Tax=Embleya sp. NPDC020630 TaxID=3363979 RepID=UPI00379A789E
MPRNVDTTTLKKLGYTVDQTPGDPDSIRDASLYLAALAKKASDASLKLAGLIQDDANAPLMGEAATELRGHVKDQLKLFVDRLAQATQIASTALSTYGTELLAAQQKGQEALNAAAPLPEGDPGLAAAKSTMATARTMYLEAVEKARKALAPATALKTSPKTVAEEFWDFFKIFTIVLTVLGVLFGGPLGLLAFGANLIVLGKTIADFANGKATGLELFLNILGVLFPSTKALLPALLSGLKNLLVGLGKGAVNLFKGAGNLLSLLSTGLKGFNLSGWRFALAYAGLLTGALAFKGGVLVGKLLVLPFKAIVWVGKTAWAVGKKGFAELKGWGSLGILLPVAGDEIAKLGLARALKIGFWERGVLGSQKDFIRAGLAVPPAAAGTAGKIGGHTLDKLPMPPGLGAGRDLSPFTGFGLHDMPRLGSSFDTAVFVPAASGLYTAHHGLGVYSFGNTLLGHEGLQTLGTTIGHGVTPQLQWNSLHDVLNQAVGGTSALHGLDVGALSPHTLGGAVESTQSFAKSAIGVGEEVRMTPLPEIRRLTHGDTTLTTSGMDRFVATHTDALTNKVTVANAVPARTLPNAVHAPGTPTSVHAPNSVQAPGSVHASNAGAGVGAGAGAVKVDVFDLLAPGAGKGGSTPPPPPSVPPATPIGPGVSALHQDNALNLLAGGSRTGDQLPAASARFTPVDLAGGNSAGALRPDLAGGQKAIDTVSALVGEKIPMRADPPPVGHTPPPPATPTTPPPPPVVLGREPLPPNALANFGAEQRTVVTKALDDVATGPGPGGKSTQGLPGSRFEAWHDYSRAKQAFDRAATTEQGLRTRLLTGDTSSGTVRAQLMVATAERANARLALEDATTALKAWGVDPLHAAPAVAEAMSKLRGLPGGMPPVEYALDARIRVPDSWPQGGGAVGHNDSVVHMFRTGDTIDHFEVLGPMGPGGTRPLLHDGHLLPDGTYQVFHGRFGADSPFEIWADTGGTRLATGELRGGGPNFTVTTDHGDFRIWGPRGADGAHPLLADARRLHDGTFRVTDGAPGDRNGFEIWAHADEQVLRTAYPGPDGTFHVHEGPRGSSDDFAIWGPRDPNTGLHPVLGEAHRLPDGTWRVENLAKRPAGDFRILGPRGADGAHPVLRDVHVPGNGTHHVYDGPLTDPGRNFEIRSAADDTLLGHAEFHSGTDDFHVTNTGDDHFQTWGPRDPETGAHPLLRDARAQPDGTYHVHAGPHSTPGQSFEIWSDTNGTILKHARYRAATDDFHVTNVGDEHFQTWGPRHPDTGVHPVREDGYALGGDRFQVFEGPRGSAERFRIHGPAGANGVRPPATQHGYVLGDGTWQVYEGAAHGRLDDFRVWGADNAPLRTGTRIRATERFRVTNDGDDHFQIWGPRGADDAAPEVFGDARRLTDRRYQVFEGPPTAGNRNFEVWANDSFRIDQNGAVHGGKVTHVGERVGETTHFRVTDRLRDTWEKWDSADLANHRLLEYPVNGPIPGVVRRIDHTNGTWQDVRPPNAPLGHDLGWEHMPFRKGTVEQWPAGPNGEYKGIRTLTDGNGTIVHTRDPSIVDGHWIEAMRDHAGKWRWVEKTGEGRTIATGRRYVRWDTTAYDVIDGVFDLNARHLFGGKVRDIFPQLDGGRFVAEKGGLRDWRWQKWDADGALQAKGRLEYRVDPNLGFRARVTEVRLPDGRFHRLVEADRPLVAFERFAPMRGSMKGDKFFSAPDKARGTRQFTFDANAQPADQFKYSIERNYVNEEAATFSKFGETELKVRRIWQQRFNTPFFPGHVDFPGNPVTGDSRLYRYWTVSDKSGAETTARTLRVQRLDGTWQDFTANRELVRESRVLADGRKIEFTADVPGRSGTWREVGGTGTGPRVFDDNRGWIDYADEARTIEVRKTIDAKGTVREYPGTAGDAGAWVDRNRFGQLVARRDEIPGGFLEAHMRKGPDGEFTWTKQAGPGHPPFEGPTTGTRTTNRAGAQMWSEGFDDAFKDFARIDGRDVLVYERKSLADGRTAIIERDGAGNYRTTVKGRDGAVEAAPGVGDVRHVDAGAKGWRDEFTDADGNVHTLREGRGDAIREYHVTDGGADPRHWDDVRNGTKIRSYEPIMHGGQPVGYLEKDIAYLQQRIYDVDGSLVVHQGLSTRIFEKTQAADPSLVNRIESKLHPDKALAKGVDSRFKLVGRGVDHPGALNDFRGYNRALADTNRRHWGAYDRVTGSTEWTFEQKVWTKVGMEFMQDFGFSVLAGMITEWINDGNISGTDWGKIFLNSAVSASFAGLMARFHELKLKPGSFSPKQFKDGLTANDFGKPFNTNPYFGDNWKTDWSNFDTALRWRSGMYKYSLGLAVNPIVAFVNGSINAAVFGDKNGVKHYGLDALKFGGVAALGSLAGSAFGPGAFKFAYDAYAAGRFWRKSGILDLGIKFGEKLIDAQLNKLFQKALGLNEKYLYPPTPENGQKP